MLAHPRITLRCLDEDLRTGWSSSREAGQARLLRPLIGRYLRGEILDSDLGRQLRQLPSISRLSHPVVRYFSETFHMNGPGGEAQRIPSPGNDPWWELIGAGWRGAVTESDGAGVSSVAWLSTAIADRHDGAERFFDDIGVELAAGSDRLVPQAEDWALLRLERNLGRRSAWKAELHRSTLALVSAALDSGTAPPIHVGGLDFPSEPMLEISVALEHVSKNHRLVQEVIIGITPLRDGLDHTHDVATRTVLAAIEPEATCWTAAPSRGDAMTYVAVLSEERAAVAKKYATGAGDPATPGAIHVGTFAHYASTNGLTRAAMEGEPVQALCGHWFVPVHDHARKPICVACEKLRRVLY